MSKEEPKSRQIIFTPKDSRVTDIIGKIPSEVLNETLEKYIIAGHMVINYCSISESKETIENILNPISKDIIIPLKTEIGTLSQQLKLIMPTVAISRKKGDFTQELLFIDLKQHFMDDTFEDVSNIGKYSDIKANGHILIESKDYVAQVPTSQVDKFWRDLETRDFKYGIFISMRSDIIKISGSLKIETKNGRTVVFINNSELNFKGHIIAYYIIKKIIDFENITKEKSKGDDIIKTIERINKIAIDINKDIKTTDSMINIIESLKTTNNNRLTELNTIINGYRRNTETKTIEIMKEIEKLEVR